MTALEKEVDQLAMKQAHQKAIYLLEAIDKTCGFPLMVSDRPYTGSELETVRSVNADIRGLRPKPMPDLVPELFHLKNSPYVQSSLPVLKYCLSLPGSCG